MRRNAVTSERSDTRSATACKHGVSHVTTFRVIDTLHTKPGDGSCRDTSPMTRVMGFVERLSLNDLGALAMGEVFLTLSLCRLRLL